jgi:hypothetical protein
MSVTSDTDEGPAPTGVPVEDSPMAPLPDLEVEIDVGDLAPARGLGPAELCEAIAAGLNTTNIDVLADAASDFRGVYRDVMQYIRQQLLDLLQPCLEWVLDCCDNDRLRRGYEAGEILVWTLPHPHDPRLVLIFESPRAKFRAPPE